MMMMMTSVIMSMMMMILMMILVMMKMIPPFPTAFKLFLFLHQVIIIFHTLIFFEDASISRLS